MYKLLAAAVLIGIVAILSIPAQTITLAKNSKTEYVIVTPTYNVESELTAARELQSHLKQITGADFPILPETSLGARTKFILVGQTEMTKKLVPDAKWASLGTEGILLRTVGDTLVLTGGRPRGVIYSVYTFLEDVIGVRWWSHNESFIPNKPVLTIDKLNTRYVPQIVSREAHFYEPNAYGVYAARTKQTGHFHPVPQSYGGHYKLIGWCHTFYGLIPPDKYFAQHPEWFSMINGQRTTANAQLCLANEEMRKELVKNALAWIAKDPEAGIISIAQNDCGGECQCPKCKAIDEKEGSPAGNIVYFVNKVAEDIHKQYPKFLVETLAYWYSRKAPKFAKPGPNVLIRLCSIELDYGIPITDPRSKSFMDDLHKWSAISHNMYIWSYIASFGNYLQPNPCLPVYGPNIREFAKNKAVGVFMQGDSYNEATCFVRLRSWVIAHLLWNPYQDENKLIKEFMDGYYGPASPYLTSYLKLIDEAYAKRDPNGWMNPEAIFKGQKLFDQAAAAVASDPVISDRVSRERIPLDYLWIIDYAKLQSWAKDNNQEFIGPKDPIAAVDEFMAKTKKYNVQYSREGGPLVEARSWKMKFAPAAGPPAELGDLTGKKTFDIQEPKFRLFGEGQWVSLIETPDASNKVTCIMPGSGTNWAVQAPIDGETQGKWHCYASVKVDSIAATGTGFIAGIYNTVTPETSITTPISIEQSGSGKYKLIDLGVQDLKLGMYFWFSPANNPDAVRSISIDRIFLVAE